MKEDILRERKERKEREKRKRERENLEVSLR